MLYNHCSPPGSQSPPGGSCTLTVLVCERCGEWCTDQVINQIPQAIRATPAVYIMASSEACIRYMYNNYNTRLNYYAAA